MYTIAHRCWSIGEEENTPTSLIKSINEPNVDGVEIDVWRGVSDTIVVSHDEPHGGEVSLDAMLNLLECTQMHIYIELKNYDRNIISDISSLLKKYRVAKQTIIFGFLPIMESIDNLHTREERLGIIVEYPWHIKAVIAKHHPDVLLLGWDERKWTRYAFKVWWSIFSLQNLMKKYSIAVVAGIAQTKDDEKWLKTQNITAYTIDMQ